MQSLSEQTNYETRILASRLTVVFFGINPPVSALIAGFNFSNPSNRFWRVHYLSGLIGAYLQI
jgi:double-stranded uracil-DNA glycosylase